MNAERVLLDPRIEGGAIEGGAIADSGGGVLFGMPTRYNKGAAASIPAPGGKGAKGRLRCRVVLRVELELKGEFASDLLEVLLSPSSTTEASKPRPIEIPSQGLCESREPSLRRMRRFALGTTLFPLRLGRVVLFEAVNRNRPVGGAGAHLNAVIIPAYRIGLFQCRRDAKWIFAVLDDKAILAIRDGRARR